MLREYGLSEVFYLLYATQWTLLLSLCAFAGGGAAGLLLAVARIQPFAPLRVLTSFWIQVVQATPLLMLLLMFYYGLNMAGLRIDAWTAAVVALSLWTSSYFGEIWRGSLESVPRGQWEAGTALGFNFLKTLRLIVLPQALRIALPPTVGYLVQIVKATALAALIGFTELTKASTEVNAVTFEPFAIFSTVALLYFSICFPLSLLARHLEARLNVDSLRPQAL